MFRKVEEKPIPVSQQIKEHLTTYFNKENESKKIDVKMIGLVPEIEKRIGLIHQVENNIFAIEIKTMRATGKAFQKGENPRLQVVRNNELHELRLFEVSLKTNGLISDCKESKTSEPIVLSRTTKKILSFGARIAIISCDYSAETPNSTIDFYQPSTTGFKLLGGNKIPGLSNPNGLAMYPVLDSDLFLLRTVPSTFSRTGFLKLYHFNGYSFRQLISLTDKMAISIMMDSSDPYQDCDPYILSSGQIFITLLNSSPEIGIFDLQTASFFTINETIPLSHFMNDNKVEMDAAIIHFI